ncbi:MAG TPA: nitroreductase family deazaflavin-dependent oxidoreductase [Chloroflexia bacterium]|nr:nitroreductase family deazaflavin-dependent oxidoreductase [Chloroflexia bacterium]
MTDPAAVNRQMIEEFRATRHAPEGPRGGRPMLLLTTTGARSGRPHTTPMMFVPDGDQLIVIASNMGAPRHPDWYHNLVARPDVTVEVGAETYPATATPLTGAERERVWQQVIAAAPFFTEHQAKTTRLIPLIALTRRSG